MKIGIVILATNAYFPLGIRLVRRWQHFYKGRAEIVFLFFSDKPPLKHLPEGSTVLYFQRQNVNWVDGTNSKFSNILSAKDDIIANEITHLIYFDADTNINEEFTEEWMIGERVAGEHYDSRRMVSQDAIPYDRTPKSAAYIPYDTPLPKMYYYGAFFGGTTEFVLSFCEGMVANQVQDKALNYEPSVNDESYLNKYFHYAPPSHVVLVEEFPFIVSDKGGLGETRNPDLDVSEIESKILENKNKLWDIRGGEFIIINE